jgi:predicted phage terminase large subunit-like protein
MSRIALKPSSPRQEEFLKSNAYITVYGGSAGSGKTYQGLMRFLRYTNDPDFVGYVIRKNATDLKKTGGAFKTALKMFKPFGITHTKQPMVITFPSGATIEFIGLDGEEGMDKIQGLEISACMIDEATHIEEEAFWWTLSRLRTNAKMEPNIWLTCNPDPDSFVFNFVEPYIYPKGTVVNNELVEGRVDPAKNGQILYFMRIDEKIVFRESIEAFYKEFPEDVNPESEDQPETFKFIGATCHDNPEMLKKNPKYVGTLRRLPRIERERLYYGNWLARQEEGGYFKKAWVEPLLTSVQGFEFTRFIRCWDLAASLESEATPNPDYTAGVLIGKTKCGKYIILDVVRDRKRSGENINWIGQIAREDMARYGERSYSFYLPQDPAAAGITARIFHVEKFNEMGLGAKFIKVGTSRSKLKRFEPFSASAEVGLVYVMKADWNDMYFSEMEAFDGVSKSRHDDMVDATSDAFNELATTKELPKFDGKLLRLVR